MIWNVKVVYSVFLFHCENDWVCPYGSKVNFLSKSINVFEITMNDSSSGKGTITLFYIYIYIRKALGRGETNPIHIDSAF